MLVVFVIVLVVFGPQKLPELARSLGKLMAEFRKASTDFRSAFEEEMKDLERQAREVERKKSADAAAKAADENPVQAATLATPAGTETPEAEGGPTSSGDETFEVRGQAPALTAGEASGERVTEGAAELVVTPVMEAVSRTEAEAADAATSESASEGPATNTNVNGDGSASEPGAVKAAISEVADASIRADVPHDQQPA
jgi:sec-independent protein translocase protein TatB